MTWVRLDDHFDEHPKIAALSDGAVAVFVTALAYCNRNLTDGFIPSAVGLGKLRFCNGNPVPVLRELESVGLFQPCEGGWMVHDFSDYQPSKEQVLKERRESKGRMGRFRSKRKSHPVASNVTQDVTPDVTPQHREKLRPVLRKCSPAPVPVPVPVLSTKNAGTLSDASGAPSEPDGNGIALKEILTEEEAVRAGLLAEAFRQLPQKQFGFQFWPCLQRMVSGRLPAGTSLQILAEVKGRWAAIKNPWAYLQSVLDKEYAALQIRLQLRAHERLKRSPPNMEVIGEAFRRASAMARDGPARG